MRNKKKIGLSEEHLRKMKYRVDYRINESARYRSLGKTNEVYDELPSQPKLTNEAGEQEDAPLPQGRDVTEPSNAQPIEADAPVPAFDKTDGYSGEIPTEEPGEVSSNPQKEVDTVQNDIIKHNIEAMKSIHSQLEALNGTVDGLNSKIEKLNSDVEEVREPSNSEKLMSKKNVSYPYYFNLNDFWKGNWFTESRNAENTKGVRELPDGTYIADFDDLPQMSKIDVQNSFNMFESKSTSHKNK